MASSDTLGYPIKKHFYKLHLESAWRAAYGALDMGDFETFLKESADRTYPDALAQIRKMGAGRSESSQIKEAQEYEAHGGIEQYRMVADGLRREGKDYEASAIEALIADLVAAQSKAKTQRKAPEKREPKQKPLVSVPEKQQPSPTDYIKDLCQKSPLTRDAIHHIIDTIKHSDINAALKIVQECNTLDEFDKYEIQELLQHRAMGLTEMKAPERIHKPQKPKPEISTTMNRMRKEQEKEQTQGKEKEELPEFKAVTHDISKLNIRNADAWLKTYHKYIPEMLIMGIPAWLKKHPEAEKFPISLGALRLLAQQLGRMYQPIDPYTDPAVREIEAQRLLGSRIYQLVGSGLEDVVDGYDFERWYTQYKHMTEFEQFKKYVIEAVPGTARKIFKA